MVSILPELQPAARSRPAGRGPAIHTAVEKPQIASNVPNTCASSGLVLAYQGHSSVGCAVLFPARLTVRVREESHGSLPEWRCFSLPCIPGLWIGVENHRTTGKRTLPRSWRSVDLFMQSRIQIDASTQPGGLGCTRGRWFMNTADRGRVVSRRIDAVYLFCPAIRGKRRSGEEKYTPARRLTLICS